MRKQYILIISTILLISCQSSYRIGTSSVSIEPSFETVSLSLAGYAAPFEGRFTLGWEEHGKIKPLEYISVVKDKMYGINILGAIVAFDTNNINDTITTKSNFPIKFLTEVSDLLVGVGINNNILYTTQYDSENIKWNKTSSYVEDIISLTSTGDKLYACTDNGSLLEGTFNFKMDISWKQVASVEVCQSLASDGKRLYALSKDKILYQCDLQYPQESWVRIGYKNDKTYNIDLSQIFFHAGKLYATTNDNMLYSSVHNSEGNLYSRAISINKDNKTVVIVGVDLCGFEYSFMNNIKSEIFRRRGIPPEAIFINASHSHFTPVTQNFPTWEEHNQKPDNLYLNNTVYNGIIQSIEESIDNAVKSDVFFCRNKTDIGFNRSLGNENAIYDNVVDVVKFVPKNSMIEGSIIFMTGCHPVYSDTNVNAFTISANFPGYTRQIIENDENVKNCVFLQGCAGDINPKDPSFRITGKKLADDIKIAMNKPMLKLTGDISYNFDTIPISVKPWDKKQIQDFLLNAKRNPTDGVARRNVRWAEWMIENYKEISSTDSFMPVYVQTINIGKWKLIGLSREATSEFSIAIRNLWPNQNVSVVAYTNDVPSYLPTDPHIIAKDYEGYDSFFWNCQPALFSLKTFDTIINNIKNKNR